MRTIFVDYPDHSRRFEINLGVIPAEESPFEVDMLSLKDDKGEVSFPVHMLSFIVHSLLSEVEKEYGIPLEMHRKDDLEGSRRLRYAQPELGVCDGVVKYCDLDSWIDYTSDKGTALLTHEYANNDDQKTRGLVHEETCLLALLLNRFYIDEKHVLKDQG